MNTPEMTPKVTTLTKLFGAYRAFKRALSSMLSKVIAKVAALAKQALAI
jgi:hypothetical protein